MITFSHPRRYLLLLLMVACWPVSTFAQQSPFPGYTLALNFELESNKLFATAQIEIPAHQKTSFDVSHITPTGAFIRTEDGREQLLDIQENSLDFPPHSQQRILYISYTKTVVDSRNNLIDKNGISLLDDWYPYPSEQYIFTISATLPKGFSAITHSDIFPLPKKDGVVTGHTATPTDAVSFVAGPYIREKLKVRDNLYVYSLFFHEDAHLSDEYLQAAKNYIQMFEKEIGPFPYNHYVITANRFPTGYGMPTFTLIGQMVLRLPFIKDTSLGHEIVHSWFGNSVGVDYSEGNWCEGLTSFLADHRFVEDKGKGAEDRKESLIKYHSYVFSTSNQNFSLSQFKSASHTQPMAEYRRAIGYNGGAFLFHELRLYLGESLFYKGVQKFYADNKGKDASWTDIRKSFEVVSGKDLGVFFLRRLQLTKPPAILAKNISVDTRKKISLRFTLQQDAKDPIPLTVPIDIKTMSGTKRVNEPLESATRDISIALDGLPLKLTIDPEYDLLRTLVPAEEVPVWSRFLGSEKKLIILADESLREQYQPFLDVLSSFSPEIITAKQATNTILAQNSLLFLGADQEPCRSIFGTVQHASSKTTIDVRSNPLNPEHVAVIISAGDEKNNTSIARRLSHYGKYSYLEFENGRAVTKKISPSEKGIRYELETLPNGGAVKNLSPFQSLMEEIATNRVVYIGETHTSYSDHLLQLRIIEALYDKNPNLAIGMEMFPASAQEILDAYTREDSELDEATFLRQSDYFNVWRFDYRLYRDILNFARAKHVKVLGLNLDREIVSEIYRSGTTDNLEESVKASLVKDRNLDMPGYKERLTAMHGAHVNSNHGSGFASGFIQAQALWDETMASHSAEFLQQNPEQNLIVIAGSQHTRKDSGIPPRVARRMPVKQVSLVNLVGESPENLEETADYFFFSQPVELPEAPKIGIVLDAQENCSDGSSCLVIEEISPHGKAGTSGLKKGDILRSIDSHIVRDMTDLRIALMNRSEGDIVKVEVGRQEKGSTPLFFDVELTVPAKNHVMPAGHP